MNKKILGFAFVLLAFSGVAFADSYSYISNWFKYSQVQSIPTSSGFNINVYKVVDTDSNVNCYISSVGAGSNISCVSITTKK